MNIRLLEPPQVPGQLLAVDLPEVTAYQLALRVEK